MSLFGGIIGIITGIPALLNGATGLVKPFTDLAQAKVKASSDLEIKKIQSGENVTLRQEETYTVLSQLQQAIILADQMWWVTRWIRPGFAYLSMLHYGAVILASLGVIKGPILALPYPMDYLSLGIIGTYFLLRPLEKHRPLVKT